jgi:MFS family permease
MEDGTGRRHAPRLTLGLLAAISTCGFIDRIVMNLLAQPIKVEFRLTDLQVAMIAGLAFSVLNAVLGIWIARFAERGNRIRFIWIGTLAWSAATAACGFANSFVTLLLARVGVGVGEAVGLPAASSAVSDCFPREKRTTAVSVMQLAVPLGAFIASIFGGMIAQAWGWRYAFWIAAAPGALFALLLLIFVPEPARGRFDDPARIDDLPSLLAVLGRIWNWRSLRHLLIGSTVASAVGFGLNNFLAAWLIRRFEFNLAQAGLAVGFLTLPSVAGVWCAGWLADRFGRSDARWYTWIPAITLLVSAPLYFIAATRTTPSVAIALLTGAALVQYCYLGITAGLFQNMMHPRMRASSTAINSLAYSVLGAALGPILVGTLSDHLAGATTPAASAAGLGMALALTALGYLWAALHYLWATRYVGAELARPV